MASPGTAAHSFGRRWNGAQLSPILFRCENRRLPLPRQILEGGDLEQRLMEPSTLAVARLRERRVADHLLDAAA